MEVCCVGEISDTKTFDEVESRYTGEMWVRKEEHGLRFDQVGEPTIDKILGSPLGLIVIAKEFARTNFKSQPNVKYLVM